MSFIYNIKNMFSMMVMYFTILFKITPSLIKYLFWLGFYCIFTPDDVEHIEDIPKLLNIQTKLKKLTSTYALYSIFKKT